MKNEPIITAVRHWVESFVVELNLCPFAKRELVKERVRFVSTPAASEEALLIALQEELLLMEADASIETTLLIHAEVLQDFYDYNDFLDIADSLLVQMDLDGVYQIASFHPDYKFGGTQPDDAENYTNRSPYPVLHILREESLEHAIEGHPDADGIPERNIALMNKLGVDKLRALLAENKSVQGNA